MGVVSGPGLRVTPGLRVRSGLRVTPGLRRPGEVADPLAAILAALYGDGAPGGFWLAQPQVNGQQVLWQDTARTVPALGPGDPVRVMDSLAPDVRPIIAPTDAARPLLGQDSNGRWRLVADGVDDAMFAANLRLPRPVMLGVSAQLDDTDSQYIIGMAYLGAVNNGCGIGVSSGGKYQFQVRSSNLRTATSTGGPTDPIEAVASVRANAAMTLRDNFGVFTQTAGSVVGDGIPDDDFGIFCIPNKASSVDFMRGVYYGGFVCGRDSTDDLEEQARAYIKTLRGTS